MIDYILTAAVGISAGVEAVVSDQQWLLPHTLGLCLLILAVLAIVNMRGVKDTGAAFILPTFLFVGTLVTAIGVGTFHVFQSGGHPHARGSDACGSGSHDQLSELVAADEGVLEWLRGDDGRRGGIKRRDGVWRTAHAECAADADGDHRHPDCAAVRNGVAGEEVRDHGDGAETLGYQSLLSLIVMAVFGRGWFYHFTMWSVFLALCLSANTAFADFPRLTRAIAINDYLPHVFILRGRRLLFSHGIYALTGFTALLLIMFGGVTDRLISLYAIGAFLAFTLSQAGMVMHWNRDTEEHGGKGRTWHMFVNGTGAVATGITTVIVLVAKFTSGAWVTALLVPTLILLMMGIKRHYTRVKGEMTDMTPLNTSNLEQPIVVIPMARWDRMTEKALRFGLLLSKEIKVVNVDCDEGETAMCVVWEEKVVQPVRRDGLAEPELVTLHSTFRLVIGPLIDYIFELEQAASGAQDCGAAAGDGGAALVGEPAA